MFENKIENLKQSISNDPGNKYLVEQLANEYVQRKDWLNASNCYANYLKHNNEDAEAHYNYAYNLRYAGEYEQAIKEYRKALSLNISQPEELHLNIAVILAEYLRREESAINELEIAIALNSTYIPALYNLGNLYEDAGDKHRAEQLFSNIIAIDPKYYDALARLAQIKTFSDVNDTLIHQLIQANNDHAIELSEKINVNFALGKALDDCKDYENAFRHYELANNISQKTMPAYNESNQEYYIEQIIKVFNDEALIDLKVISDAAPIFICGMFRSGSTLVEQILAAHPKLTAGGEREFFIRLVEGSLAPFPTSVLNTELKKLKNISKNYLADIVKSFPGNEQVIDKRPENFLYVGLIKLLFPNARFIYTQRNPLDNCLSVYFLRLGAKMNYSVNLSTIAHYYKTQAKLMTFWQNKYADSIHVVSYDELVQQPKEQISGLLSFLNLEWNDNCLNFHQVKNKVKTASVWQVRKPLYKTSSGRWENYQRFLPKLTDSL